MVQPVFSVKLLTGRILSRSGFATVNTLGNTFARGENLFARCAYGGVRSPLSALDDTFSSSCHSNSSRIIPARVLHKWDFKMCPVSNFARDLLGNIYNDPLYDANINPRLMTKVKRLRQVATLRSQLEILR